MSWKQNDMAVIDSPTSDRDLETVILRRRYVDKYGSNDYFGNDGGVIPNAWIVESVNKPRIDCLLVSEYALTSSENPNQKTHWDEDVQELLGVTVGYVKVP